MGFEPYQLGRRSRLGGRPFAALGTKDNLGEEAMATALAERDYLAGLPLVNLLAAVRAVNQPQWEVVGVNLVLALRTGHVRVFSV
jgi:hypothetical protein